MYVFIFTVITVIQILGIDRLEADISELTSLVADDRLEGAEDLVGELSNLLKTWQGIDYRADQLHFKNIFEKVTDKFTSIMYTYIFKKFMLSLFVCL